MIVFLIALTLGAPQGRALSGPTLEQKTYAEASLLRCPVCQGMSVADSPSTVALDMKQQVREMLARGYTEEQILGYFEQSYGQFVLLKPKNPLVWVLPIMVLLVGAALVITTARRLSADRPAEAGPHSDPYLSRVRELVDKE
jgi:cytochrome c-type biogenesis protein CcmH